MSSPRDFGRDAQEAAEAHLQACEDALEGATECESVDDYPPSPASAPFCGCQTCVVREVLHAAWPIIEECAAHDSLKSSACGQ